VLTDELYFTGYKITTEAELNGKKVALPPGLEEEQIIKVKRPLFAYVKTAIANNFDPDSPIGISYYGNALDTIQALDIAFDGLNNEVLLGRKRIFVPHTAIKYVTNPETNQRTRYYDPDDSVYVAMKGADNQTLDIHDNTQELRIEEIKLSIQTLLDIFCMQVGFSQGFLSFDGSSVKTATEVISNNSKTFKTKSAFENEIKDGMYDIIQAIAELLIVNGYSADNKCVITFNDSIIEDRNAKTEYWINLVNNGLCTKKKALMKIHGIDEEAAQKMLDEIAEEQPTPPTIGF
jgi:A118 family predicted phage portal protein